MPFNDNDVARKDAVSDFKGAVHGKCAADACEHNDKHIVILHTTISLNPIRKMLRYLYGGTHLGTEPSHATENMGEFHFPGVLFHANTVKHGG